jgi:hypothetical protein
MLMGMEEGVMSAYAVSEAGDSVMGFPPQPPPPPQDLENVYPRMELSLNILTTSERPLFFPFFKLPADRVVAKVKVTERLDALFDAAGLP